MTDPLSADTVIVGGGAAGCVLAARLSENPDRSVLLLEAGRDFKERTAMPAELTVREGNSIRDDRFLWGYEGTLTDAHETSRPVYRGRVIGGSGTINGCIYLRAMPGDYDAWDSPLWTWDAVLPSLMRIEHDVDYGDKEWHGVDGPMEIRRQPSDEWLPFGRAFHAAARALGHRDQPDLNEPGCVGVGPMPRNVDEKLIRLSPALAYLLPARTRSNLSVLGDTSVTRIRFDGVRATGVDAVRDGELVRIDAGEVILAAGAIASPQLLMLSGVGPSAHLADHGVQTIQDLPGVGENLSDHGVCDVTLQPRPEFVHPSEAPSVQVTLLCTAESSSSTRDLQIGSHSRRSNPGDATEQPLFRLTCSLGSPVARGRVSLVSADPQAAPRIEYRYMHDEADLSRMRSGLRICAELAAQQSLAEITVPGSRSLPDDVIEDDVALDAHIRSRIGTAFHGMGTCKLGAASDSYAVVDDHCRVHGLDALRVVDTSIAPATTRANAHSTALMVAEHVAAQIQEER